jgi:hypothetical protein
MTNRKSVLGVMWLCMAAMGSWVSACGAGAPGAGDGAVSEVQVVGGVALIDASTAATVSLRDSSAEEKTRMVSTKSDGSFSIDVAELTPPYVLRVMWGDDDAHRLYAVADGNENLDVTPITDVALSCASGDGAERLFESSTRAEKQGAATRARAHLASLVAELSPLLERYGITDPLTDRDAVRVLLQDVRIQRDGGMVTVTNRATGEIIFEAPLFDLASGTFDPGAMPPGPGMPPPPATCAAFTYSAWGACEPGDVQSRSVLTSSPSGCVEGSPVTTQACTYVPPAPATCTAFTYSMWSACQADGSQSRSVVLASPTGCTGGTPVLTQACTYVPPVTTCTSFAYSTWGACQSNNTQTRSVLSSSPTGCTGGTPALAQACTYVPPIDGAALYTQYCSGCHGNAKKGSSATAIQGAIDSNRGGMGSTALRALTPAQVAAIAAAP